MKKSLKSQARIKSVFSNLSDDETIEEKATDSEESVYRDKVYEDIVKYTLNALNDREHFIIKAFFGLEPPYIPKTLQDIASICHIHIERARQLRDGALQKLNKENISKLAHDQ